MIDKREEYTKMAEVEERLWWYKTLHTLVYKVIKKKFGKGERQNTRCRLWYRWPDFFSSKAKLQGNTRA